MPSSRHGTSRLLVGLVRVRVAAPGVACARHLGAPAATETTILVPTPLYSSASSHSNPESIAEAKADANADYEEGGELVLPPEVGTKLQSKPLKCPELQIPWKQPTQQQEVSQTGKTGEEVSRWLPNGGFAVTGTGPVSLGA
uniref:Uncharacterized protein n=1 Tax=Oryza barthii TaxID=65489 RepID=A0A0D3FT92_9ORYZ